MSSREYIERRRWCSLEWDRNGSFSLPPQDSPYTTYVTRHVSSPTATPQQQDTNTGNAYYGNGSLDIGTQSTANLVTMSRQQQAQMSYGGGFGSVSSQRAAGRSRPDIHGHGRMRKATSAHSLHRPHGEQQFVHLVDGDRVYKVPVEALQGSATPGGGSRTPRTPRSAVSKVHSSSIPDHLHKTGLSEPAAAMDKKHKLESKDGNWVLKPDGVRKGEKTPNSFQERNKMVSKQIHNAARPGGGQAVEGMAKAVVRDHRKGGGPVSPSASSDTPSLVASVQVGSSSASSDAGSSQVKTVYRTVASSRPRPLKIQGIPTSQGVLVRNQYGQPVLAKTIPNSAHGVRLEGDYQPAIMKDADGNSVLVALPADALPPRGSPISREQKIIITKPVSRMHSQASSHTSSQTSQFTTSTHHDTPQHDTHRDLHRDPHASSFSPHIILAPRERSSSNPNILSQPETPPPPLIPQGDRPSLDDIVPSKTMPRNYGNQGRLKSAPTTPVTKNVEDSDFVSRTMPRNFRSKGKDVTKGEMVRIQVPIYSDSRNLPNNGSLLTSKQAYHSDPNLLDSVVKDNVTTATDYVVKDDIKIHVTRTDHVQPGSVYYW